ncbi:MAG: hypothetical protein ACSW8D_03280 [Prevotella sp.]
MERMIGQRTSKGTEITRGLVDAVRADESDVLRIKENNAKLIASGIKKAIVLSLEEIGIDAEKIAAENAPVDTGRLSASITHAIEPSEDAVYIGTNVPYALPVHEGVHGRSGNPFLRRAATDNADRYRAILKKHLENS